MPELDNAQDRTAQLSEVKRLLLKKRLLGKPIKSSKPAQIYRRADNGFPALSFAQQRLWFLYQLEPDNLAYNIAFYYRLRGRLDVSAFERSLNEIVRRHEALRTAFASVDGEPIQVIASSVELPLSIVELEGLSEAEKESKIYNALIKETRHNFDLTKGPVLRTTLLRAGAREHFFILVVHHIAFDGWSAGIFLRSSGSFTLPFLPANHRRFQNCPFNMRILQSGSGSGCKVACWKIKLHTGNIN